MSRTKAVRYEKEIPAVMAWTEALTTIGHRIDLGLSCSKLPQDFFEAEIGTLTVTLAMIDLWNRIFADGGIPIDAGTGEDQRSARPICCMNSSMSDMPISP